MEATDLEGPEIINARLFTATRERVFGAFSDPKQLVKWFGPNGFTNTIQKFDLRAGGEWHLTMIAPDGTEYPNEWVFLEVARRYAQLPGIRDRRGDAVIEQDERSRHHDVPSLMARTSSG